MRHFEDLIPGPLASVPVAPLSRAEIMDYARAYDPQAWHLDDEAAAKSVFGALCASGWHSSALIHRVLALEVWPDLAKADLVRVQEMRWAKPVFPDEPLRLDVTITNIDPDPRGDFGQVETTAHLLTETGTLKVSATAIWRIARRIPGPPAPPLILEPTPEGELAPPQPPSNETVWWEDLPVGVTRLYGRHELSAQEIADFATKFGVPGRSDPSPWLIVGLWMRMTVANSLGRSNKAAAGSPGFRDLRQTAPVKAGDVLTVRVTSLSKVELKSRSDLGFIYSISEVLNQDGVTVLRFQGQGMVRRRPLDG